MNQRLDEPSTLSEKLQGHSHLLPYISLAIAILAPAGYLIGLGFQSGYLSVFGGLTSAFPLSVTDAYVFGYYTITLYMVEYLPLLLDLTVWLVLLGVVCFFTFIAFIGIKIGKNKRASQPDSRLIKFCKKRIYFFSPTNNDFSKAIQIVFIDTVSLAKKAYWLIWAIVIWIGITLYSYEKGKELALESKEAFLKNGCHFNESTAIFNCIRLYDHQGNLITEGLLLGLSSKRYGVFTDEGAIIAELPANSKIVKPFDKHFFFASKQI